VREQFRIAEGEELGYDDPDPRGHSIEFRINGEDPGATSCPPRGPVTVSGTPVGPRRPLDAGVEAGDVIGGTSTRCWPSSSSPGDRQQALERSRRALAEFEVEGMADGRSPSTVPSSPTRLRARRPGPGLQRAHPLDRDRVRQHHRAVHRRRAARGRRARAQSVTVEVGGKRVEVTLPSSLAVSAAAAAAAGARPQAQARQQEARWRRRGRATGDSLASPMQGTIVKVAVSEGDTVEAGDLIVVLEAMKMEQPLNAHKAGTITNLAGRGGRTASRPAR
jgi:acetyl-CoA/propionyl-CoA carboxylase, biotin carboxylase, biotin carboxyl carrier protein